MTTVWVVQEDDYESSTLDAVCATEEIANAVAKITDHEVTPMELLTEAPVEMTWWMVTLAITEDAVPDVLLNTDWNFRYDGDGIIIDIPGSRQKRGVVWRGGKVIASGQLQFVALDIAQRRVAQLLNHVGPVPVWEG